APASSLTPPVASTTDSIASAPGVAIGTPEPAAVQTDPDIAAARVAIETPRLTGTISLLGGRVDELFLNDYRVALNDQAIVQMLAPVGTTGAYYAVYGWAPGAGLGPGDVPGANTMWRLSQGTVLTPETPLSLTWDNGKGLRFTRMIAIDDNYMFRVTQSVTNAGAVPVSLAPYGILARHGEPQNLKNFFILHEGVVGMSDGELIEIDYDKMPDFDISPREGARAEVLQVQENGWLGFTDHYWMTTLIPEPGTAFKSVAKYDERRDIYQTEVVMPTRMVTPGQTASVTSELFAGAKEWETIRAYQGDGIDRFLDSIDWGWFFFLTKPIFSMARMKELQPEMEKLKESAGDDRQKLQKGMVELYKKNQVNPAAGCLPILLQIPIFFSLYKVIFVTIELRQAPFFGPFQDLSTPDPTSIMNLFGLLPWTGPTPDTLLSLIFIGILPLLLGISMWLQQKLNPAPTDPTQQMIFAWMPWIFMFMLGGFASGLIVYWISNNVITFVQQYLIMRAQGYTPDLFGNIQSSFKRKAKDDVQ
ncbi:MAG: membrane protein insertase YidC, partial [Rhodobacteraceae bacterium]|nr:membrane protein insertase YidC [Paracoccaceae bacterium]